MKRLDSNEQERLRALASYDVLDTNPEAEFDQIVQLASHICQAPMTLVSLVDARRQWFKSRVGLDATETPREFAFCHHAIQTAKPFVVNDATKDARFANNPLVTSSPNVRFYAGVPLINRDGFALGTLCAIDQKPRELTADQLNALQVLADQVMTQLELRRSLKELERKQADLLASAKLSALGEMSASIAHEINNPLAIALGRLGILQESIAQGKVEEAKILQTCRSLEETLQRISKTVISLRGFARDDSGDEPRAVLIGKIVSDSIELARPRIKDARVQLQTEGVSDSLVVRGRSAQLTQVLLNLIGNSVDAIEGLDERWIKISAETKDGSCFLRIQDSGSGIPEDIRTKVMQAFFTTKAPGKGTGLGLSISKTLIESHGGKIRILPAQPHTTFEIELPTFEAALERAETLTPKAS